MTKPIVWERRPKAEVDALIAHHTALRNGMASTLALSTKRTPLPRPMCCEFADEVVALRADIARIDEAVHALLCAGDDVEAEAAEMELRAVLEIVMEAI